MKLFFSAICFFFALHGNAQVISSELLQQYSIEDVYDVIDELGVPDGFIPVIYEVDFYRITYLTPHPNGSSVEVSGALCIPQGGSCPFPLSSYQHGTIARRIDAPSFQSAEGLLAVLYASAGYVSVAADYIGLGTGQGLHLYVHAESEANACLDLLRAAVELQDELGYNLNEELFIWGYSQGGHATAALQRKIELEASDEFTITASAPMSGPYDISGVQAEVLTADEVYPTPGYLPYVVMSYQEAYGNLYTDLTEVFLPEYAAILPGLFDGTVSMGAINNACPDIPNQMLQPDFLEAYETDPQHPMRLALQDNDLMNWSPQVPTRLYYCNADDQVSFENAVVALEAFEQNGSTSVEAIDLGAYNHGLCAPFAMFAGYNWFEEIREEPFSPVVNAVITPAHEEEGSDNGSIALTVDAPGNWTISWSNGSSDLNLENLIPGNYLLNVISEDGCIANFEFEVGLITDINEKHQLTFSLYPVPANQFLHVEAPGSHEVQLLDLRGKVVQTVSMNNRLNIDCSGLSPGMYVIVLDGQHRRSVAISH